tara:strand:- start:1325 stop:1513 length:189 start_codon:yes stop_codon:yes gene_type:complete
MQQLHTITYAVQINGKLAGVMDMPAGLPENLVIPTAAHLLGVNEDDIRRSIFIPDKLVNILI